MKEDARILIIDDEEIVHKSCKRIFRRDNYAIDYAYSGEEGLRMVGERDYDIVVTDLMMPGLGGMDVLRHLVEEKPEITVIVFTGYATVESVRQALKLGAFDYVPKPFTPDELRDVIRNAADAQDEKSGRRALDLMAIVSHDLRSPIAVVHATAETLHKGYFGKLEPQQRKTLEAIIRNCVYLEDIIRSYLDLSNMDLKDLESFKEEVDLVGEVVHPVVELPEHQSNFRRMRIETDYRARPRVEADPNLLKIVVANLLNNAVKYGRDEAVIRLRVEERESDYLVSVWNQGVGISAEEIEGKLFRKRVRLKQKGTEGIKGNGLGLYICKTIVEKHQGRIWCESEVGAWTEFLFTLPKRADGR
jgi:two-component system, sensor histidine kinase and response regulator